MTFAKLLEQTRLNWTNRTPAGIKSQLFLIFPVWGLWGSALSELLSPLQEAAGALVEGEINRENKWGSKSKLQSSKKQRSKSWLLPTRSETACSALIELRFLWMYTSTCYILACVNMNLQKPNHFKQSSKGNLCRCLNRARSLTTTAGTNWSV